MKEKASKTKKSKASKTRQGRQMNLTSLFGMITRKQESPCIFRYKGFSLKKRRLPTLPLLRSTIGVTELNFSVRNGKRWNLSAIVT